MSSLPTPSRNPFASRAAAVLRGEGDSPWGASEEVELAKAYALIGLTDELRRANQIAIAQAVGDTNMLAALDQALSGAATKPAAKAA